MRQGGLLMTIFLICMIPLAAFFGFMICALFQAAGAADRHDEKMFSEYQQKMDEEDSI